MAVPGGVAPGACDIVLDVALLEVPEKREGVREAGEGGGTGDGALAVVGAGPGGVAPGVGPETVAPSPEAVLGILEAEILLHLAEGDLELPPAAVQGEDLDRIEVDVGGHVGADLGASLGIVRHDDADGPVPGGGIPEADARHHVERNAPSVEVGDPARPGAGPDREGARIGEAVALAARPPATGMRGGEVVQGRVERQRTDEVDTGRKGVEHGFAAIRGIAGHDEAALGRQKAGQETDQLRRQLGALAVEGAGAAGLLAVQAEQDGDRPASACQPRAGNPEGEADPVVAEAKGDDATTRRPRRL